MKYTVKELPAAVSGQNVYGKAFVPESVGKTASAVVLSHGYNSSHADLEDAAAALAEKGVFAYCYDFRGGSVRSKSEGKSTDMSVRTEIADLKAVIDLVKNTAGPSKIFLYGESQGGFISALTAADMPGEIAGLFLLYPAFCIPHDWREMFRDGIPDSFDFMGMTVSRKFYDELPEYDVFEHIRRYPGKVTIAHGTADGIVAYSYAERAAKSFPNAELIPFEGEGHGFSPKAREKLVELICEKIS